MATTSIPRYDYFQSETHLTVSIYEKGLNAEGTKDRVVVDVEKEEVKLSYPAGEGNKDWTLGPLYQPIDPEGCSFRILGSKLEIKLAKAGGAHWPQLLANAGGPSGPSGSSAPVAPPPAGTPLAGIEVAQRSTPLSGGPSKVQAGVENAKRNKKNWDKLVEGELEEKEDASDPNAGGDGALQKFFSSIYSGADEDTKRAMIKSFTESGGTTLSTDWSSIGKETTPIRPPEGMEARKYQ